MAKRQAEALEIYLPKVLLVGIQAPYHHLINADSYIEEFVNLVRSSGTQYKELVVMKLRDIDNAHFFTKGKLEELQRICVELDIEEIILSEAITPQQERNLTDALHCKVFDRTRLILDIFEKAAHSAEGKAQVEIAKLQHLKTRLTGKGIDLSQQSGGIGVNAGPGETLKQRETRHIELLILRLKRQIERIQKTREEQRKRRLANKIPQLCLIGYTNAGKSTILNGLTKSSVLAEDKLFATLDTTTRELYINGQKKGLISDTVGFIQQLPPQLIQAFKSTLEELQYADLLIQVIDASDSNWESHIKVVHDILNDLNIHKDMLYVFNKIDKAPDLESMQKFMFRYEPYVMISATSKEGLEPLRDFIETWSKEREKPA
jgi:GTP-binding protein HflX